MPKTNIDDPDLPLSRLFERWPAAAAVFLSQGMLCFGCPIAPFHTLADAAREHGCDLEEFSAAVAAAIRSVA